MHSPSRIILENNILKFLLPIDEQIGVHNMDAKESAAGRMNSPRGPEVADPWFKYNNISFVEKISTGLTSNQNESIHNLLFSMVPKPIQLDMK